MDEQKITSRFEAIEKRLDLLEGGKKVNSPIKLKNDEEYTGLAGGIRHLIDDKRLDQPKSVAEIFEELKKEGYHYPKKSVEKLLSVNFMKNSKTLNRVKENKKWKYVIRK